MAIAVNALETASESTSEMASEGVENAAVSARGEFNGSVIRRQDHPGRPEDVHGDRILL